MDIQAFLGTIAEQSRKDRTDYHLTLGELITKLCSIEKNKYIRFSHSKLYPGTLATYRGFYSDLAIAPTAHPTLVVEFMEKLQDVRGLTLEGYKGGEFLMGDDTPLWVDHWGKCSGIAVLDIQDGSTVTLLTKQLKSYRT